MDLQIIKKLCEDKHIEVKRLAELTGMSEQNLHRCIRLNKIQASDLEKIAKQLNSPIAVFFDDEVDINIASGNRSVAVTNNSGNIATGDTTAMAEKIELLERLLDEKERLIKVLMKNQ